MTKNIILTVILTALLLGGCRGAKPAVATASVAVTERVDTIVIERSRRDTLYIDSVSIVTLTSDSIPVAVTLRGISRGRLANDHIRHTTTARDTLAAFTVERPALPPSPVNSRLTAFYPLLILALLAAVILKVKN